MLCLAAQTVVVQLLLPERAGLARGALGARAAHHKPSQTAHPVLPGLIKLNGEITSPGNISSERAVPDMATRERGALKIHPQPG